MGENKGDASAEAAQAYARQTDRLTCDTYGHELEILEDGTGQPLSMQCGTCGTKWKVEKE